jgi:hypothetical protein
MSSHTGSRNRPAVDDGPARRAHAHCAQAFHAGGDETALAWRVPVFAGY